MESKPKLKLYYQVESIESCLIRLTLSLLHLKHELVPIKETNKELTRKVLLLNANHAIALVQHSSQNIPTQIRQNRFFKKRAFLKAIFA